jgi:hypothetical protein
MRRAAILVCFAPLPLAASAQDGNSPPAEFFVGQYRMVGTDTTGGLVDLQLRLDIVAHGLAASTCAAPDAGLLVLPGPDGDHYLEGNVAGHALVCDYFMSYENNPMLTCFGDWKTRLTLWVADFAFDQPLSCGD